MGNAHARDYAAIAFGYARDAVADTKGKRFCKWVRLAAKRHLSDLRRSGWGYYFDEWYADDVCDFIEKLPHVEGVWDTDTITLEPPQIFILCVVFGWRRKSDGHRRFTRAYIEMARKNAKSTLTAGVALYCLCCEGEIGPQILIGATTGDQAKKVFTPAKLMVQKTADLRDAFGVEGMARSIPCTLNGGYIQPINSKSSTQDGWNPHVGILDELHAHKDRGLFDVIRSAFGARKNPLMWMITTAGYNTIGVCYEQRLMVSKVLEGALEADHYFGIVFTIDEDDDPYDESVWIKANPLLDVAVQVDELRNYAQEAKASADSEGEFKTKRLNIWLNAAGAWLNMAQWKACAGKVEWEDFEGLECFVGADLADKDDITAVVLCALKDPETLIAKPVFFIPEAKIRGDDEKSARDAEAPYRRWTAEGHIVTTPGDWIDHGEVENLIRSWIERFPVRAVTFDQFAAAQLMATRLNEDFGNIDEPFATVLTKSAPKVTDPAKDLEARVKAKRIIHDGNPVMTWMASNVVVSRRVDGSIIPKKETPMSPNKIDGIDALVNGLAPLVMGYEVKTSVYETRGALVL